MHRLAHATPVARNRARISNPSASISPQYTTRTPPFTHQGSNVRRRDTAAPEPNTHSARGMAGMAW